MLHRADRPVSLEAGGTFARRHAGHGVLHRCGGGASELNRTAWPRPSHGEQAHAKVQPWGEGPAEAKVGEVGKGCEAVGGPRLLKSGTAPCSSRVMGSGAYFSCVFSASESTLTRPDPC